LRLNEAAEILARQVLVTMGTSPGVANVAVAPSGGFRDWYLLPGGAGIIGLGAGAILMFQVAGHAQALRGSNGQPSSLTPTQAQQELALGLKEQTIGIASLGVGGAALITGGLMLLLRDAGAPRVAIRADAKGASLVLQGALP
jgi:hypothetical protein